MVVGLRRTVRQEWRKGGKITRDVSHCLESSSVHKNRNGTKSIVFAERKRSPSLVLFFLVVVAILSSMKKPLKMEPKHLSQFPSLPEKVCVRTKNKGGRACKQTAGEDDSALL